MQAMPDDVIKIDNGIMRFEGPGRYARNVDLDAEPMKTIVATMAAKKIYSDHNGGDRTRFSPGRLRRAEGSYPRRLSRQLGKTGSASHQDAQGGRADRCRYRRLWH